MNDADYLDAGAIQNTNLNIALLHELFIREKTNGCSKYNNGISSHFKMRVKLWWLT
jgi:hypothetical protein